MDVVLVPFLNIVLSLLGGYRWCLIVYAVLSWLLFFGVVNRNNQFVYMVVDFLRRIIEPALRPIRRLLPITTGIDLSLLILLMGIYFLEMVIVRLLLRF